PLRMLHLCDSSSLIIRPPPRSPLFPYTTLFRSGQHQPDGTVDGAAASGFAVLAFGAAAGGAQAQGRVVAAARHLDFTLRDLRLRSEEHTSELQSRENLVCRLLLEKKKQNKKKLN